MGKNKIKYIIISTILLFSILLISGCGNDGIKGVDLKSGESLIAIKKDGTIEYKMVEDISGSKYNIEDLRKNVVNELKDYNDNFGTKKDAIQLETVDKKDNNAQVVYHTDSFEDLQKYFNQYETKSQKYTFIIGKVSDIDWTKYNITGEFKNVKGDKAFNIDDILKEKDLNVIITNKKCKIKVTNGIKYVDKNNKVEDNVVTIDNDEVNYIFYKN